MWAACMPPIGLVGHAARQLAAACRALHYMPSLQQFAAIEELADGILRGCRLSVSRGVTLTESSRLDHQLQAAKLLRELQKRLAERRESSGLSSSGSNSTGSLLPLGAAPLRIGISGPPGAGKSSLIETLGCALVEEGERVAVLAIDPSSQASGGAILGDKTRMPRLSASLEAYVRPSPARGTLGGVARATFDAILICEAAGYSKVLVETVGVGQSETAVQDLVDIFVLVLPPVGGDELQVIKRGVTEMADIVVINKADGSTEAAAARAAAAFRSTLSFHRKRRQSWQPTVLTCSAHTGLHVDKLLQQLAEYQAAMQGSGELARLRRHQRQRVAWTAAEEAVLDAFRQSANVRWLLGQMTPDIASGALAPRTAAELLAAYNAMYD